MAEKTLQEAVRRITAASRPRKVIPFGSRARDEADECSDVDLVVIEPEVSDKYTEMVRLRGVVGSIGAGVDLLVYSEAEVEARKAWCSSPIYWALREEGSSMKPDERKPATVEAKTLLRMAARDYKTFKLLRDIAEAPLSSICFHAQQAVEK
ncbi:nucleotidyltransferase domain-containing protein [Candidatus Methylomirabilis sp.]|uniref:nucleotidyltransferase domain-containing protein n=1 Tax=Candidatus Methylomirabilis sp. TaxID=2032687 RepID=UPI0030768525